MTIRDEDDGIEATAGYEPDCDQRYDDWKDRQMERRNWPGNEDALLYRVSRGEDEMERARRRGMIREAA